MAWNHVYQRDMDLTTCYLLLKSPLQFETGIVNSCPHQL